MEQITFSQCYHGILFLCDLVHFVSSVTNAPPPLFYFNPILTYIFLMTLLKHAIIHIRFPETKATTTPIGAIHLHSEICDYNRLLADDNKI